MFLLTFIISTVFDNINRVIAISLVMDPLRDKEKGAETGHTDIAGAILDLDGLDEAVVVVFAELLGFLEVLVEDFWVKGRVRVS